MLWFLTRRRVLFACRSHVQHIMQHPASSAPWWGVFRDLREARKTLGLSAAHLNTLAALLSFIKPDDRQMIVFASNRTILERLNGLCERSFQRHINSLIDAGLIARQASPNGKRYRVKGYLAYGFDLKPLLGHAEALADMAECARGEAAARALQKHRIQHALAMMQEQGTSPNDEAEIRKMLRRNLAVSDLQKLADRLQEQALINTEILPETSEMSCSDSQHVGQYLKSDKEVINDMTYPDERKDQPISLNKLVEGCPEAMNLLEAKPRHWPDLQRSCGKLASWIGIAPITYANAVTSAGAEKVVATLMSIIQLGSRIKAPAAYFYALLLGKNAKQFDHIRLLDRVHANVIHG